MPELQRIGQQYVVETDQYRFSIDAQDGTWAEISREDAPIARLYLPGAVAAMDAPDVTMEVSAPLVKERADAVVFTIQSRSSRWGLRATRLRCREDVVDLDIRVNGDGLIDTVHFFGGFSPTGPIRSTPHFNCLFTPAPTARLKQHFDPNAHAIISVHDHHDRQNGAWVFAFTPAPLCYCVRATQANWLALAVCANPGSHTFEDYIYDGSHGFELRLNYAGHTAVAGEWTSPRLALVGGADEYDALEAGCAWRNLCGASPQHNQPSALWWRSPIFSGWGEQLVLARATGGRAADYCTQANYERWIEMLGEQGLNPGIIVIDDKWQDKYGDPRPDKDKWPRMHDFIRQQHEAGRHVLLWWKAWDPEGVPVDEQVQGSPWPEGSVDPTNRAYWQRLQANAQFLIGDLGADGFKVDFTHRTPYGHTAQAQGESWGVELLRDLIAHLSDAAKDIKEDALILTQTPDPYFANIVDMIRLNSLTQVEPRYELSMGDILTHMTHRARVARAASADWLIDTDNWPNLDREQWLGYVQRQPYLGIPSLYYVTQLDSTGEALRPEDYALVAQTWKVYRGRKTR